MKFPWFDWLDAGVEKSGELKSLVRDILPNCRFAQKNFEKASTQLPTTTPLLLRRQYRSRPVGILPPAAVPMSTSIPLIVIDDSSDGSSDGSVIEVMPGQATSASAAAAASNQNVVAATRTCTNQNYAGTHHQDDGDSASAPAEDESSDGDEEIQDMGTTNAVRLPHARHDCPNRRFVRDVLQLKASGREQEAIQALKTNAKTCDLCYCMLCDEPASECNRWSGDTITADSCHCLAGRQGTDGPTWIALRAKKKGQIDRIPPLPALLLARRLQLRHDRPTTTTLAPGLRSNASPAKPSNRRKRFRPTSGTSTILRADAASSALTRWPQ